MSASRGEKEGKSSGRKREKKVRMDALNWSPRFEILVRAIGVKRWAEQPVTESLEAEEAEEEKSSRRKREKQVGRNAIN